MCNGYITPALYLMHIVENYYFMALGVSVHFDIMEFEVSAGSFALYFAFHNIHTIWIMDLVIVYIFCI